LGIQKRSKTVQVIEFSTITPKHFSAEIFGALFRSLRVFEISYFFYANMIKTMLVETTERARPRWLRMSDLPFSRTFAYSLMSSGHLVSVVVNRPGSDKGVRLIDANSLDAYLENRAADQKKAGDRSKLITRSQESQTVEVKA
jgi:hypothetical protein